jgi:IS30 family transposase
MSKDKKTKEARDYKTGLTHKQLKAAQLVAEGWSIPKVAEAVGVHHNTVRGWKKNIPVFARVVREYKPPTAHPLTLLPMQEMTPEALDERLVQLVCPAIEAMGYILGSPDSNDMAKMQASKFVLSTLYTRLVHQSDVAPQQLSDLKEALRIIK